MIRIKPLVPGPSNLRDSTVSNHASYPQLYVDRLTFPMCDMFYSRWEYKTGSCLGRLTFSRQVLWPLSTMFKIKVKRTYMPHC